MLNSKLGIGWVKISLMLSGWFKKKSKWHLRKTLASMCMVCLVEYCHHHHLGHCRRPWNVEIILATYTNSSIKTVSYGTDFILVFETVKQSYISNRTVSAFKIWIKEFSGNFCLKAKTSNYLVATNFPCDSSGRLYLW